MYTAAVLKSPSILIDRLQNLINLEEKGFVFQSSQGPLPHHMTINLGSFDPELNDREILGKTAILEIDGIWWSEQLGVCAACVDKAMVGETPLLTINDKESCKHITICLKPPAKPVHSNRLFREMGKHKAEARLFMEMLKLEAVIEEIN
jgi:hypothetical protein